jgi:hypothetical protein
MENIVSQRRLSVHKEHEFLLKLENAGLNDELSQKVIDSKGNELALKVVRLIQEGGFDKSIVRAIKILGQRRVFNPEQVAKAFNPFRKQADLAELVPPQEMAIPYSDEVLKKHADGKWLLIYSYGLLLREQRQMFGTDKNQQPCFCSNDWWLKSKEDNWATKSVKPGWYLVSLEGRFSNQNWPSQEESIRKFGTDYERVDEHLMGEVCFSAFLINKERPLENFYHWGKSLISNGGRIAVGIFGRGGLRVDLCPPDWSGSLILRVCPLRKS